MKQTTIVRTLLLMLFCTMVATYSFAQVQSPLVSPTAPALPGAASDVSKQGQPNPNSNQAPTQRVDPKDLPKPQDRTVAPTTLAPVEIRAHDGKLEKALTKQEDIITYHQKPKVSPEQGRTITPDAVEKFQKEYTVWMAKNKNWQEVVSQGELMFVNKGNWTGVYHLAAANAPQRISNQPNNNK
jgi:hypothetical protein